MFEITVRVARLGRQWCKAEEVALSYKANRLGGRGRKSENGMSVMFTLLHRVGPVAGLAVALFATVAWIGLVGYTIIKLF